MKTGKRQQNQQILESNMSAPKENEQQSEMLSILAIASENSSPISELKEEVDRLKESLERARTLVAAEEEELASQAEIIAQLEEKVKVAEGQERLNLEIKLIKEREKWELLEATLLGQICFLKEQQANYQRQYQILQQQESEEQADTTFDDSPESEPLFNSPQLEKNRPQWRWWTGTLITLGLLMTGAVAFYSQRFFPPQPSSSSTATELPLTNRVSAIGYLEPSGEVIHLSASLASEGVTVEQLLVQQGERVEAGQVIAILDSHKRLQAALAEAEAQVKVAQARLEQVKAGAKTSDIQAQDAKFQRFRAELTGQIASQQAAITSLEAEFNGEKTAQEATIGRITAELRNAQNECHRYQQLLENGAVSEQERDRLCLIQETTEKQLIEARAHLNRIVDSWQERIREAKANLNRTMTTLQHQIQEEQAMLNSVGQVRSVDIQVALSELQLAQVAAQKAQADLNLTYVRAPKAGQILKIHSRPGELVGQHGIVALGETEQMYVKAEVYETDISQVSSGQRATIKSNGIVGDLQGTVEKVGLQIGRQKILDTDPAADVDARVVEVLIRLNPEDSQQVAGLTNLQVNVIIDTSTIN